MSTADSAVGEGPEAGEGGAWVKRGPEFHVPSHRRRGPGGEQQDPGGGSPSGLGEMGIYP